VRTEVLQETVTIPTEHGALAGELAYPTGPATFACLLINPHPFMGGRMDNRLIAHLATDLASAGGVTLRFDYGGVGESSGVPVSVVRGMADFWETGSAPCDDRMIQDAAAARDWLIAQTSLPLAIAGYSFGAFAATRVCDERARAMILISPTLEQHAFSTAAEHSVPACVIYSDDDFATPAERIRGWAASCTPSPETICIPGADHFFKDHLGEVATACARYLKETLSAAKASA
jgi:alpha/beta superfamily hydrolase